MITKLDSLNDIANEFGVPLTSAGNISYYYNNKNPDSPVQPVMAGGRITDWIGYDHHTHHPVLCYKYGMKTRQRVVISFDFSTHHLTITKRFRICPPTLYFR